MTRFVLHSILMDDNPRKPSTARDSILFLCLPSCVSKNKLYFLLQDEAFDLADQVVVFNKGSIEQIGTPDDIKTAPASPFVLNFVGDTQSVPSTCQVLLAFHKIQKGDCRKCHFSSGTDCTVLSRGFSMLYFVTTVPRSCSASGS